MAQQPPTPPAPTDNPAHYSAGADEHGPYYAIYFMGRMIAYSDSESSAGLIVAALNLATRTLGQGPPPGVLH